MQDENKQPETITLDDLDKAPSGTEPTGADIPVSKEDYVLALSRATEENSLLKQDLDKLSKKVRTAEI